MSSEVIRDGSAAGPIPDIPALRPVSRTVFADRAARLQQLAPRHALEEYLRFAAALAAAQHEVLQQLPGPTLPDALTLRRCREHGLPPLAVDVHPRDAWWRNALHALLDRLDLAALPPQARERVGDLRTATGNALERAATHLLCGAYAELDPGSAPFLAAALQAYWTRMALDLDLAPGRIGVPEQPGLCAVCGSPPVASVVRIGGAEQGLRFLVCSLCGAERHLVRVKCSACDSTKGISYYGIEGASPAVKAETCDQCKTYLKIFYLEKDSGIEPCADDLATMTLDMLVADKGYDRVGPNLYFLPGNAAQ